MPLTLTGNVHIAPTADQLYDDIGRILMAAAMKAVSDRGVFHLALSGGGSPQPLYVRLMIDPIFRSIPWAQTHIWMVDERCVPLEDERSNFRMIRETITDHVPTRRRQIHPMPVETEDAASRYEHELRRELHPHGSLDFVLLGMGADAHTASLFPASRALNEADHWVAVNDGPTVVPPPRLTMTFGLLNASRQVAILVTGWEKAAAIRRVSEKVRESALNPAELPITGVRPDQGVLTWFLDGESSGSPIT